MKLYHASNLIVEKPDTAHARRNLDFGAGFYTTSLRGQAEKWCARFLRRGERAFISEYDFPSDAMETTLRCKIFPAYTEEWLDFIARHRRGEESDEFDLIVGGVANDKVFNTCELFFKGYIGKAEALRRLAFEAPNNQYCFKTAAAIAAGLVFITATEVSG